MYRVIGSDGKEYGPVSEEELRLWLAQGRLTAESKIKAEGTQEWKRIGEWPRLGALVSGPVPPLATPGAGTPVVSGLAIASFVLGVLGIVTAGLAGIAGLILGILALVKISRSQGRLGGSGLAIAGICVSGAMLLLLPIMAAILLPALAKAKTRAQSIHCMNNVKQLNLALIMYANDHNGVLPPADQWCDLIKPYTGGSEAMYHCPAPGQPQGRCSYAFNASLGNRRVEDITVPARTVLIFSSAEGWNHSGGVQSATTHNHPKGFASLGYSDGHAQVLPYDQLKSLEWGPPVQKQ
jgi:hypothetical protein